MNHGGHEVYDLHEMLAGIVNILDSYMIFRQYVTDSVLLDILDRQYQYITDQYNIIVECFQTGQEPNQKTSTYMMKESNDVVYGVQPTQPKKPNQSLSDVKDGGISGHMLGLIKANSSLLAMTSVETTNPVVRRVLAALVPNYIEMAYEIFLYQNKNRYYQVPQLSQKDMQYMVNGFQKAQGTPQMPNAQTNKTLH
ncbi:spore coat protein [Bacillus carboniphilus]|uniref:Spore coat protein n=2 Tax=Bacillus carboniphilus TaxID=86663 RepID=A0ABY9JXV9_9BACI|nr:spore coat protein [Bacillus carboniphilus]WLR44217.1 spore coat protein [Bacillus carboniphilus]